MNNKYYNNWYKTALSISDLLDRNLLNKRVRLFKDIVLLLNKAKLRFVQDAYGCRKDIVKVLEDKKMSSFSLVSLILKLAASCALDNYLKSQGLLLLAIKKLVKHTDNLLKLRKLFSTKVYPEKVRLFKTKKKLE